MERINNIIEDSRDLSELYLPVFFSSDTSEKKTAFASFLDTHANLWVHDQMEGQLRELIKSQNPSVKIKDEEYPELVKRHLDGNRLLEYGI